MRIVRLHSSFESSTTVSTTEIFRKLAGMFMKPVTLAVDAGTRCGDVVPAMAEANGSCVLVTGGDGRLAGIVTDRDIARRVTFKTPPDVPISAVMTAPVHKIGQLDYAYRAVALMRRHNIRHIPVVDDDDRPVGLLDLHDALALTSDQMMDQIDSLSAEGTQDSLRAVKAAQVGLAQELFDEHVPAHEIQQLLTDINNDIYRRVVASALKAMEAEGKGTPPVEFAVLVMGSGGRGENFLFPDQDNGFILADYPDADHTAIDEFFIDLAERMTTELDAIGFPLCRGNVMAINPVWRKTAAQWRDQTVMWSRKRNFLAARLFDLFFDFRSVSGRHDLAFELRRHVTEVMARSQGFLHELYRNTGDHGIPLGWFNRLLLERDGEGHNGRLNLKLGALLPLVEGMRLLALKSGIADTTTLGRIAALGERDALAPDDCDYLADAFRQFTTFLLRQQIEDFQSDREVGYYIYPNEMLKREHDQLIDALKSVDNLKTKLRVEFTADVF